jgi:hypothetical protein
MEAQLQEIEQKSEKKKVEVSVFIVSELLPSLISPSLSNYRQSYNSTRSRMGPVDLYHLHSWGVARLLMNNKAMYHINLIPSCGFPILER